MRAGQSRRVGPALFFVVLVVLSSARALKSEDGDYSLTTGSGQWTPAARQPAVEPPLASGGKQAEEAVKRIQSRLHAEAGRISEVTNAADGQLSEALPEGGLSAVRARS